jgi:hypothetical protein
MHHHMIMVSIFAVIMLTTINCDASLVKIAHHDNVIGGMVPTNDTQCKQS